MESNEKQAEEKKEQSQASGDSDAGNHYEAPRSVIEANKAREGLAAENARFEKNLREMRELTARQTIGGELNAGQTQASKKMTPKEYSDALLRGEQPDPKNIQK